MFRLLPVFLLFSLATLLSAANTNPRIMAHITITPKGAPVIKKDVITRGHVVSPPSGGTHRCDGTNNRAHPSAGATVTAALDDTKLGWDGFWDDKYKDFFITTVAGIPASSKDYWQLSVNGKVIDVGGCQARIKDHDKINITMVSIV